MDDELSDLLASTVVPLGLELVDLERRVTSVRVVVDRTGGVDLEAIAAATRAVSAVLDAHDPFPGQRYTLEVSSPGLERRLRTPAQFKGAIGETVTLRISPPDRAAERVSGTLTGADDAGLELATDTGPRRATYDEVERARTVFVWGAAPKPSPSRGRRASATREA